MQYWIAETRRRRTGLDDFERPARPPISYNDLKISALPYNNPIDSARPLADTLKIGDATMIHHFEQKFDFYCLDLEWAPCLLSPELTAN
jgi:hypothetical protein